MVAFAAAAAFTALRLLALLVAAPSSVEAVPAPLPADTPDQTSPASAPGYWISNIKRQGSVAFGDANFKVFRNVKDYGAKGEDIAVFH